MKIENFKLQDLKPAKYNPRQMDETMLARLVKDMAEFGCVEPLVVNQDMTVIGGHQRLKAAEILGWQDIPCFVVDLDKTKEKVLNLALNKIHGEWDFPMLKDLISELDNSELDIELTGFDMSELENFLGNDTMPDILDMKEPTKNGNDDFILHVILDNEAEMQTLFEELNKRGFTVKR